MEFNFEEALAALSSLYRGKDEEDALIGIEQAWSYEYHRLANINIPRDKNVKISQLILDRTDQIVSVTGLLGDRSSAVRAKFCEWSPIWPILFFHKHYKIR